MEITFISTPAIAAVILAAKEAGERNRIKIVHAVYNAGKPAGLNLLNAKRCVWFYFPDPSPAA